MKGDLWPVQTAPIFHSQTNVRACRQKPQIAARSAFNWQSRSLCVTSSKQRFHRPAGMSTPPTKCLAIGDNYSQSGAGHGVRENNLKRRKPRRGIQHSGKCAPVQPFAHILFPFSVFQNISSRKQPVALIFVRRPLSFPETHFAYFRTYLDNKHTSWGFLQVKDCVVCDPLSPVSPVV